MRNAIVLALLLSSTTPAAAFASSDRTDDVLARFKKDGLEVVRKDTLGSLHLNLYITSGAQAIIKGAKFDVPDPAFDLKTFGTFVVDTFCVALDNFAAIEPRQLVTELNVVIEDKGAERANTISEAAVGSRVISLDLRRWDKLHLGYRSFLAGLTSIHEFTHVANYQLDDAETKKHRELTAIVFEGLDCVHRLGLDFYKATYLDKVAGKLSDPSKVLGDDYRGNDALRYLAHSFITKVLDGTYGANGDRQKALEAFAVSYLESKSVGAKGFDEALAKTRLTDRKGAPLTLETIQNELQVELTAKKAPEQAPKAAHPLQSAHDVP